MTISVQITNTDSRPAAKIVAKVITPNGNDIPGGTAPQELAGGESTTIYVHSGQSIKIDEVRVTANADS